MATKPQSTPSAPNSHTADKKHSPADPVPKRGAQILHDTLVEQGVEVMFGYGGGAIMPTFDTLYDTPIRFILTRHEQGAGQTPSAGDLALQRDGASPRPPRCTSLTNPSPRAPGRCGRSAWIPCTPRVPSC